MKFRWKLETRDLAEKKSEVLNHEMSYAVWQFDVTLHVAMTVISL